ncbi:phage integrase family protein [Ideonella sp. DXS22W]|uniref:Phage integrase family protein n=1 Tax=Pseudaquabacterium inlustre TaxID=2984192 RepID=A0ABU9CHK3_9BURK
MTPSPKPRAQPVLSAAATRRLGSHQMAFVRAWAEGLDAAQAWQRYIGQGQPADGRRVRAELQRLLDVLRGVARAQGRADLAALLRRDPEAMAEAGTDRPSLDDFRAQQPEDFYSEAELLELYEATHGAPDARSGARRRQRLRARQVAALQWLETVAVREPRPDDAVGAWLDERLAARLARAGLHRLDDLKQRIQARGYHWHRGVERVGPAAAQRLAQWWQEHARTLGALPAWALTPPHQLDRPSLMRRAAMPARPVPLERLRVPAGLTGSNGRFRAAPAHLRIAAADDLQALQAWLSLRTAGSATWRAYRKEAERLTLWALWIAGKPVSSLDAADLHAYAAFLAAPPADWTAPRGTPRWHDDWRPFEGPLAERSRSMALGILRGLFAWWQAQGYLAVNGWTVEEATPPVDQPADQPANLRVPTQRAPGLRLPRALDLDLQIELRQWIDLRIRQQGRTPALLRLRAMLCLALDAGLRPAELAAARIGWLQRTPDADTAVTGVVETWLQVTDGLGCKARLVQLPAHVTHALRNYLDSRPLDAPAAGASHQAPLLAQLRTESALSAARLYELFAQAFSHCADELSSFKPDEALRLRQVSTIWLRNGYGLRAAAEGVAGPTLQQQMGHRSRASAAAYSRLARGLDSPAPTDA